VATRNYILILLALVLISLNLFSQGKEDFMKKLFDIKLKYIKINSYGSYKLIAIDDAEVFLGLAVDNGAELTGYFKGDTLVKVVEQVGLSNRIIQNEYFLENNKLFFVYSSDSIYAFNDSTQAFDYSKLKFKSDGKYYFENEKLFDTILSNKDRKATKEKDAASFLDSIKKYAALLKQKFTEEGK